MTKTTTNKTNATINETSALELTRAAMAGDLQASGKLKAMADYAAAHGCSLPEIYSLQADVAASALSAEEAFDKAKKVALSDIAYSLVEVPDKTDADGAVDTHIPKVPETIRKAAKSYAWIPSMVSFGETKPMYLGELTTLGQAILRSNSIVVDMMGTFVYKVDGKHIVCTAKRGTKYDAVARIVRSVPTNDELMLGIAEYQEAVKQPLAKKAIKQILAGITDLESHIATALANLYHCKQFGTAEETAAAKAEAMKFCRSYVTLLSQFAGLPDYVIFRNAELDVLLHKAVTEKTTVINKDKAKAIRDYGKNVKRTDKATAERIAADTWANTRETIYCTNRSVRKAMTSIIWKAMTGRKADTVTVSDVPKHVHWTAGELVLAGIKGFVQVTFDRDDAIRAEVEAVTEEVTEDSKTK